MLLAGSPLRFYHLVTAAEGITDLDPGLSFEVSGTTLSIIGEAGTMLEAGSIGLLGLDTSTSQTFAAADDSGLPIQQTIVRGHRYLLAFEGQVHVRDVIVLHFNEALPEEVSGIQEAGGDEADGHPAPIPMQELKTSEIWRSRARRETVPSTLPRAQWWQGTMPRGMSRCQTAQETAPASIWPSPNSAGNGSSVDSAVSTATRNRFSRDEKIEHPVHKRPEAEEKIEHPFGKPSESDKKSQHLSHEGSERNEKSEHRFHKRSASDEKSEQRLHKLLARRVSFLFPTLTTPSPTANCYQSPQAPYEAAAGRHRGWRIPKRANPGCSGALLAATVAGSARPSYYPATKTSAFG